ncbi:MAG TPA: LuxR C-terminal-related transcriptional regulator [Gaiellales bacterium]|nr:LuxR C-terminal-related transcriptional regulator [Gaiellales bacterium]
MRSELIRRLRDAQAPVIALGAPAGYGKTMLLGQWADSDPRPFAWLSLDSGDDDPAVLLHSISVALEHAQVLDADVVRAVDSAGASSEGLARLATALFAPPVPFVLVLDDVHVIRRPACRAVVATLAASLGPDVQLAIAGRNVVAGVVPVARLRAQSRVLELGVEELALDEDEAILVLSRAGVVLSRRKAAEIARVTEGWAAGVYLAALSLNARAAEGDTRLNFGGNHRLVRDYLRLELISRLDEDEIRFLTRTSVLDRMCASLCDALVERDDSAAVIESLEQSNLLVVPLDAERQWYRYHHLFRQMLRGELERREPYLADELNRRAADWCEDNGALDAAVDYADRAGDASRVERLVEDLAVSAYRAGRARDAKRWLANLDEAVARRRPQLGLFAVWLHALDGRALDAQRWADEVDKAAAGGVKDRGIGACKALVRALLCVGGVSGLLEDAQIALEGIPLGSPWRPTALLAASVGHLLAGHDDEADAHLADAVESALSAHATDVAALALAQRSLMALERGDAEAGTAFAAAAQGIIEEAGLVEYGVSALASAASARAALEQGDPRLAAAWLPPAERRVPLLTYAVPWLAVQVRLELARVRLALADASAAHTLLAEADAIRRRRPSLGTLDAAAERLGDRLLNLERPDASWASTLTGAELRLLPLLTTHLSFREIGERLFVSRNTVKSEAISMYRKLGVSSRSDAIDRAVELGLVDVGGDLLRRSRRHVGRAAV